MAETSPNSNYKNARAWTGTKCLCVVLVKGTHVLIQKPMTIFQEYLDETPTATCHNIGIYIH